jgi:hypothetical protein
MRNDYPTTIHMGAESLRPVRPGDNLQTGSSWATPAKPRKLAPSQRLAQDRRDRFAELGHRVAIWTACPIGAVMAISALAGWLK